MPEPTTAVKTLTAEEKLNIVAGILKSACTGKIEPWDGKRGPMFNAFLKNNGQDPSGVVGYPSIADLAKGIIEVCKSTKYFIRFQFSIPNGSGGMKQENATLVSISPQGYLVFAGRESHQVSFTTGVDKVIAKKPVIENVTADTEGNVDLGLGEMKTTQSDIVIE